MTENKIAPEMKRLLLEEIAKEQAQCPARSGYNDMQKQVQDIHEVLIGSSNRYYKGGKGLVERLGPVITHYEAWETDGSWDSLGTIIEDKNFVRTLSMKTKVLLGISGIAGLLGLILAIGAVIELWSRSN